MLTFVPVAVKTATADPFNPGEVRTRKNLCEAGGLQLRPASLGLIIAMFKSQPATGLQIPWCRGNDLPNGIETIPP